MNDRWQKWKLKIAWKLPTWLVYWASIRLIAHATTGEFGNTNPTELSAMDALDRWGKKQSGDPAFR